MSYKLIKAYKFIEKHHGKDRRLSGETRVQHILKVVDNLKRVGINDEQTLLLAYLHHILDSSDASKNEIVIEFGKETLDLIERYEEMKKSELKHVSRKELNHKFFVQTFVNLIKDPRILLVRMADKTASIVTAYALPRELRIIVAEKALYLYAPICQLLGIYTYTKILQNEGFKILHPQDYIKIKNYVEKKKPIFEHSLIEIKIFLENILFEQGIEAKIEGRIKHIYSIYKKLLDKGKEIENMNDIGAIRILVNTVEECYMVEDVLKQLWEGILEQRKDYIHKPKPSGYRSIHNVFQVDPEMNIEIQIKTYEIHRENELGLAGHSLYKIGPVFANEIKDNPEILKTLNVRQLDATKEIKHFSNFVYVLTPKGDIFKLPSGSTLVDFAYYVHLDIGNRCMGGTVNGQIQKLDYVLKDGDRIEIKVSPNKKKPSEDWLEFVKTSRAKLGIRKTLRAF